MKKALVLNGSANEIPLIETAKKLGYYVITTGNNPSLIGHGYADAYQGADYSDCEAIYQLAKDLKVDAIIPCANDFSVISAAYASERLGLKGHDTYENARILGEKDRFKAFGKKHNFAIIPSEGFEDEAAALAYIREHPGYPLMIKPSDLSGGKGITRVNNYEEAQAAVKRAFSMTKRNHVVIEPYIEGIHHGVVALIVNEKVAMDVVIHDRYYKYPFLISFNAGHSGFITPALRKELVSEINRMAQLLHLADGEFTLQFILKDGRPYYVETMRRQLGNFPISCASRITGFDWYDAMVKMWTGHDRSAYPIPTDYDLTKKFAGYLAIMPPKNGKLKSIWLDPALEEHVFFKVMVAEPGYQITDYMEDKLGYITFEYDTWEEIHEVENHMYDYVHVEYEE